MIILIPRIYMRPHVSPSQKNFLFQYQIIDPPLQERPFLKCFLAQQLIVFGLQTRVPKQVVGETSGSKAYFKQACAVIQGLKKISVEEQSLTVPLRIKP